ncbi:MAG: hypothetical protein PVH77_00680 [Phycisphaerales bacterium]|jgi:hypothetical protein
MGSIKSVSKFVVIIVGFLGSIITIFGFIVNCVQWFQGDWQKKRAMAWLFDVHSIGLPTWAWIGLFLVIVIFSVFVFWLITRKSKGTLIKDENAIKHMLEMSWEEMKEEDFDSGKELYSFSGIDKSPFKSSLMYNKPDRLMPGSAKKYLPEIICKEKHYKIESIEGDSIIIVCTHRN